MFQLPAAVVDVWNNVMDQSHRRPVYRSSRFSASCINAPPYWITQIEAYTARDAQFRIYAHECSLERPMHGGEFLYLGHVSMEKLEELKRMLPEEIDNMISSRTPKRDPSNNLEERILVYAGSLQRFSQRPVKMPAPQSPTSQSTVGILLRRPCG